MPWDKSQQNFCPHWHHFRKPSPTPGGLGLWTKESNDFLYPVSEYSQLFPFPWRYLASSSLPSPCQQLLLLNETNSWPGRSSRFVIVGPSGVFIFPDQWHLFQAIHIPRAFVILITSMGKAGNSLKGKQNPGSFLWCISFCVCGITAQIVLKLTFKWANGVRFLILVQLLLVPSGIWQPLACWQFFFFKDKKFSALVIQEQWIPNPVYFQTQKRGCGWDIEDKNLALLDLNSNSHQWNWDFSAGFLLR